MSLNNVDDNSSSSHPLIESEILMAGRSPQLMSELDSVANFEACVGNESSWCAPLEEEQSIRSKDFNSPLSLVVSPLDRVLFPLASEIPYSPSPVDFAKVRSSIYRSSK